MRYFLVFLSSFLLSPSSAFAADCEVAGPATVKQEFWDFSGRPRSDFPLLSHTSSGTWISPVTAHFAWDGRMQILFDSVLPPGIGAKPYSIYRLELKMNGFFFAHDFGGGCDGIGKSIFPGEYLTLPEVKVPPEAIRNDGYTLMEIRVWGR